MSSMRDMYVGITFQDNASRALNTVDRAMDVVERSVHGLGLRLDDASDEFRSMGRVGLNAIDNVEDGLDDAEREARGFSRAVENSSDALNGLKRMAAGIGGVIAGAFAVDKVKDFATSGIELAAGTKALNSQFEQVFGLMELTAEAKLNNIANQAGILPDRLKGSFVQMAAFAKTTGADTAEAMSLAERATMAAADSAAFLDRDVSEVTDNLQSLLKGNFENDAALGFSATEATRNIAAMDEYGKKFKDLSESQKQLTLLKMFENANKDSGAIGQAAKEADGYENVIGNLKSAWDGLKGTMMAPFLDTVTSSVQGLTKKMQGVDAEEIGMKMKSSFDSMMDVAVPTFGALKDGFGWLIDNKDTIVTIGSGLAAGFAAFKAIQIGKGIFDMVKGFSLIGSLTNPVGIAVVAIGGLVAGFVWLRNNSDMLMEKWETMKSNTSSAWAQIKDDVGGAVEQVGGFFTGLKDKAVGLWETIKQNPMLLSVVGPIGAVVGAGMTLYQNWDNIKLKAGELWVTTTEKFAGIKQSVSDFVQPAISWFDTLGTKWDNFKSSLSNFKMPGWVSSIGGAISGAASKVSGLINGSHATGLENVPFDGYRAELHKGEAVLTANQANGLRSSGILTDTGDGRPELNMSATPAPLQTNEPMGIRRATETPINTDNSISNNTTSSVSEITNNASNPSVQISAPIELIIQGNADDAAIQKLLSILPAEVRRIFEEIFREKLAGIGG